MRFLVITDHHLGDAWSTINRGYSTAWALDRVLNAIALAGRHHADFILCTGDLVDSGADDEYAFARKLLGFEPGRAAPGPLRLARGGLSGLPLYIVPGNHDPREAWLRNLFPDSPLEEPLNLRWKVGAVTFAYLDLGTGGRAGKLSDASLDFLDDVFAESEPLVLVLHHHPVEVGIPWLDRALPVNIQSLWDRLSESSVLAVLFGHAHISVDCRVGSIPVLGTRSTCFQFAATDNPLFLIQPLEYRLVIIDEGKLRTRRYQVPLTGEAKAAPVA